MQTPLKHLLLLLLALPALALAAPPTLSPEGYGVIRFGMTLAAGEKAVGQRTRERRSQESCQYVSFRKLPGIYFMVEKGVVVRADTDKNLRNSLGARIGMDIRQIAARHPEVTPAVKDDFTDTLIYQFKAPDRDASIALYTDNGKVTNMWAGISPAYSYEEGCM
jgi:hypothetical protein